MPWPDGTATRTWMRSSAMGTDAGDLLVLEETTAAATEVIRPRLDPDLMKLSGTITNASLTANVATLTTAVAHGLAVGETVTVTGSTDPTFDGSWTITAVSLTTLSFALVHANIASAPSAGTFVTVDRCPVSVGLAIKIRGAALFVRRDSANGMIRMSPDLVVRISRFDADVDQLLSQYTWGDDPAPGDD